MAKLLLKKSLYVGLFLAIIILIGLFLLYSTPKLNYYADFFKHPLVLIVFTFLFTTLLGSSISQYFQLLALESQFKLQKREHQMKEATAIFSKLSNLMEKRLYLCRKYYGCCNDYFNRSLDKDKKKVNESFEKFNSFLYEWNEGQNVFLCQLEQYFGVSIRKSFEMDISKDFIRLGTLIRNKHLGINSVPSLKDIIELIEELNPKVQSLNNQMLKLLKEEKVGSFLDES